MKLTEGNIYKQLIRLSGPLVLGNILQQLYNTIDAWIIGRYAGMEQFAAAGVAGSAMNLFLFFIMGACTGISVIFAQLYGAEDLKNFRKEHFQVFLSGILLVICISAAGTAMLPQIVSVLRTPDHLTAFVETYLKIVLAGLPLSYLYNMYSALLRSTGNVRAPLLILGGAAASNLLLDILFVKNLETGIRGAAAATVMSQGLSVILSILYMNMHCRELVPRRKDLSVSAPLLKKTAGLAFVTGIHQAGLYIGKLFVQSAVNSCGTDMITAYTATTRIEAFVNSFGDSGAAATSVVTAQNFGAENGKRVRKTFRASAVLLTVFGLLCSVLLYITSSAAAIFMLSLRSGAAYEQTVSYLKIIAFFYVFCFLGNTFAGYFDGTGRVYIPFIGAATHITMRVVLSFLWIHQGGLPSVALATGIGWIYVNLLWGGIYLYTNRKKHLDKKDTTLRRNCVLKKHF